MQHKLLHVDEKSRGVVGETISSYANTADTSKKDALVDFARGGFFVEGKDINDFGQRGSPQAAVQAELAITAYASDDEILAAKLTQAGGQALTGYFEELLWNIVPKGVDISKIQLISIEKDIQAHYLTDKDGDKYVQIYMGVKSISFHNSDGTHHQYSITSDGSLAINANELPTTNMAELNTRVKLETQDQDLKFKVESLNIGLNHSDLNYNPNVFKAVINKNQLDKETKHTEINYTISKNPNRNVPKILTGIATALIAATGIGLIAIAGYVALNGGLKKAFNKASHWLQKNVLKLPTNSLEHEFKESLNTTMPEAYPKDPATQAKHEPHISTEESQSEKRKSVSGEFEGSWNSMSDKLKNGDPKRAELFESEADVELDLDTKEDDAEHDHPKDLTLEELNEHLPDPSEDAEDTEEPTKD